MNNNGLAYISAQPYSVRLMTGGQNRHDTDNEWNQKLLSFADAEERFHTEEMFNGIKIPLILTRCFARTAGAILSRFWHYYYASFQYANVGFCPVLEPLNADTLEPNTQVLSYFEDGAVIKIGALYMNGVAFRFPQTLSLTAISPLTSRTPIYISERRTPTQTRRFPSVKAETCSLQIEICSLMSLGMI